MKPRLASAHANDMLHRIVLTEIPCIIKWWADVNRIGSIQLWVTELRAAGVGLVEYGTIKVAAWQFAPDYAESRMIVGCCGFPVGSQARGQVSRAEAPDQGRCYGSFICPVLGWKETGFMTPLMAWHIYGTKVRVPG